MSEGEVSRSRVPRPTIHPSKRSTRLDRMEKERNPNRAVSSAGGTPERAYRTTYERYLDGQL
jgi:hypothetical protein